MKLICYIFDYKKYKLPFLGLIFRYVTKSVTVNLWKIEIVYKTKKNI